MLRYEATEQSLTLFHFRKISQDRILTQIVVYVTDIGILTTLQTKGLPGWRLSLSISCLIMNKEGEPFTKPRVLQCTPASKLHPDAPIRMCLCASLCGSYISGRATFVSTLAQSSEGFVDEAEFSTQAIRASSHFHSSTSHLL